MLGRQPPNEKHQKLPYYIEEYKPKTSTINFESGKQVVISAGESGIENRRFEGKIIKIA